MALTEQMMTEQELDCAFNLASTSPIWETHDDLSFFIEGDMIKVQGYNPELVDEDVPYSGHQWAKCPIKGEGEWELNGEWIVE